MLRLLMLLTLAISASAAKPTDYSTDMVTTEDGQVIQKTRLRVSGQRSRMDGSSAGSLGRIATIVRRDMGVIWTLYLDQRQYTEAPVASANRPGRPDLANLDLNSLRKEFMGRETVLGQPCSKLRVTVGKLPNGQPMLATVWLSDSLDLPLRIETMGITQENHNLRTGPQPDSLFEIPAGFMKTNAPGRSIGGTVGRSGDGSVGRPSGGSETPGDLNTASRLAYAVGDALSGRSSGSSQEGGQYGGQNRAATGQTPPPVWRLNMNYPGGDYRTIDMATSDPTSCKAACDRDARCRAWTLVKPEARGGMGYCWLKDSVPEEAADSCCISGLKGAGGSLARRDGQPRSRYELEMNMNRGGDDYRDFVPARASAELCAEACANESRCRSWTWVKSDLEPPRGHCWLKNRAPAPAQDDCCISGVKR